MPNLTGLQILRGCIEAQKAGNILRFNYSGKLWFVETEGGTRYPDLADDGEFQGPCTVYLGHPASSEESYSGATIIEALDQVGAAYPDEDPCCHQNPGGRYVLLGVSPLYCGPINNGEGTAPCPDDED